MFGEMGRECNKSGLLQRDGFVSYSSTVITPSLTDYAEKYLNETEETRAKGLQEFREIMQKDFKIPFCDEDNFILCYLRTKKFDAKKAAELFRRGIQFIDSHRSLFDRVDSAVVRQFLQANIAGFLPYRDSKERAIAYIRAESWDPEEISAEDTIFGGIVTLRSAMENPVNQVAGFVAILDLKNLKLEQVLAISSWLILGTQAMQCKINVITIFHHFIRKIVKRDVVPVVLRQRCCPCIVKEIHLINMPPIFKVGWKLVKPLLSEKIRKRIMFHKSTDWNSLHNLISPKILPSELGGMLGPFSNQHWIQDIDSIERQYYERLQTCSPLKQKNMFKK